MFILIVTETSVVKQIVQSKILRIVESEQPAQQSSYIIYKTAVATTVTELSSCVVVEVDVLGSTSLIDSSYSHCGSKAILNHSYQSSGTV